MLDCSFTINVLAFLPRNLAANLCRVDSAFFQLQQIKSSEQFSVSGFLDESQGLDPALSEASGKMPINVGRGFRCDFNGTF